MAEHSPLLKYTRRRGPRRKSFLSNHYNRHWNISLYLVEWELQPIHRVFNVSNIMFSWLDFMDMRQDSIWATTFWCIGPWWEWTRREEYRQIDCLVRWHGTRLVFRILITTHLYSLLNFQSSREEVFQTKTTQPSTPFAHDAQRKTPGAML